MNLKKKKTTWGKKLEIDSWAFAVSWDIRASLCPIFCCISRYLTVHLLKKLVFKQEYFFIFYRSMQVLSPFERSFSLKWVTHFLKHWSINLSLKFNLRKIKWRISVCSSPTVHIHHCFHLLSLFKRRRLILLIESTTKRHLVRIIFYYR